MGMVKGKRVIGHMTTWPSNSKTALIVYSAFSLNLIVYGNLITAVAMIEGETMG
jgi:hypothetical protein